MTVPLRSYQEAARRAVHTEFSSGIDSTLLVKATGTGKTVTFCQIAKDFSEKDKRPVLVLAHRTELLLQAREQLSRFGFQPEIEKADQYATAYWHDAVVASVQTLSQPRRLEMFKPDYFSLIITDEAHHATSATYRKIYERFKGTKHLGVTATPNRHDEVGLKNIYQSVAFQYSIQDAIRDGWLCPVRGQQVQVDGIHLEDLKVVAGEFSQPELDAMLRDEETLQQMVLPTLEYAGNRPTIIFTPGVEHAHEIANCFNRIRKGSAVAVDGGMSPEDRHRALRRYETAECQFLVNVGICTEGYDHPPTACIALFRPTRSLGLLAQMIGRGTRLAEGKQDVLVLDFVGVNNTVRTMTVMDVLDGSVLSDVEHDKAQELQAQGYSSVDALAEAKKFVAGLDAIKAKMRALHTSNAFDVLQMFAIPSVKGMYGGDLATDKQIEYLVRRGLVVPPDLEKGEASKLIEQFIDRQNKGLATFKQIRYLRKLGYQDNFIDNVTFDEASRLISQKVAARV